MRDLNAELSTFIGVMPAGQALAIITFSTVVHGRDLAVATGQAGELPEHLAEAAQQVAAELVPVLRPRGLFAHDVDLAGKPRPLSGSSPLPDGNRGELRLVVAFDHSGGVGLMDPT